MAPHASILAWRIPWTEEPSRLPSMRFAKSGTRLSNFPCQTGDSRSHPGPSACLVARMRGATNALSRYVIIYVSVGSESADTPSWLIGSLPTPLFKLSYISLHCASWGRAVPSSSRCPPAGLTETNSSWWGEPHGRGRWAASRTRGPQAPA